MIIIKKVPVPPKIVLDGIDTSHLDKQNTISVEFTAHDDLLYIFSNWFRRNSLSQVPSIATNNVNILKNTSSYNDDYITSRISLAPCSHPPGVIERVDQTYRWIIPPPVYTLHKKGNGTSIPLYVQMRDFLSEDNGYNDKFYKGDPETNRFVNIVILKGTQEFKCSFSPVIGMANKHAAFNKIGKFTYDVIKNPVITDGVKKGKKGTIRMNILLNTRGYPSSQQYIYDALFWGRCHLLDLKKKLYSAIHKAIEYKSMTPVALDITLNDETNTNSSMVVGMIRHLFMNNIGKDKHKNVILFASHMIPHPHKNEVVFRLQHKNKYNSIDKLKSAIYETFKTAVEASIEQVSLLEQEWIKQNKEIIGPTVGDRYSV